MSRWLVLVHNTVSSGHKNSAILGVPVFLKQNNLPSTPQSLAVKDIFIFKNLLT